MKKSEQFDSMMQHVFFAIGNQEILKEEAVQQVGETMMTFVVQNYEQILRGLKIEEACAAPPPELLDLMAASAREIWSKEHKPLPKYDELVKYGHQIGQTIARSMFSALWEIVEKKNDPSHR